MVFHRMDPRLIVFALFAQSLYPSTIPPLNPQLSEPFLPYVPRVAGNHIKLTEEMQREKCLAFSSRVLRTPSISSLDESSGFTEA